ncbi:MAG TPA: sugar transferase [Candidatus Paceibacterota bacterium]|nr:sugar transferase [Candidatus Paceibacterota bacterium]
MKPVVTEGIHEAAGDNPPRLPLWKRALDLGIILVMAPAILLLGVAVALVVRLGSDGPVFFRQLRVGQRGRRFVLYKFRTMKKDAETDSHRSHTRALIQSGEVPMTKLDAQQDPRLIPLGAFLRATGLDELPQIINVLRGDMSLVGPRPCIPYEYDLYEPWQKHRLDAVPGLTGLWQVSGKNRTTFEQMVNLDIEYARRQSLWLDLSIILRTLPALWRQCQDQRAAAHSEPVCAPAGIIKSVQS